MKKLNKSDNDYALKWAKKIRAVSYLGGKCSSCNLDDFRFLDFHHVDSDSKIELGNILRHRWSIIESEIKKCVLLCRNCHHKTHGNGNSRSRRIKEKLLEIKGENSCSVCGYNENVGSLEFHHKKEKLFNVNVYRVRHSDVAWEDVMLELDKCDVVCSNCHILKHINLDRLNRLLPNIKYKVDNSSEKQSKIDREVVEEMFVKGMRQIDISRSLGCSRSTISEIIKELGLMDA